jgi:hypothetical protein
MKQLINLKETLKTQESQIPNKLFEKHTTESKRRKLLNLLLDGWVLSKQQIRAKTRLLNEGDAIFCLRGQGYCIEMKKVKNENTGTYFAIYYMPEFVKDLNLILKSYEK